VRHYVISDLHLGMGRLRDGSWHKLEDFMYDEQFKRYLDFIARDGGDELIINGDWIDFMQLEPFAYQAGLFSEDGHQLGWTEDDSLKKLENCVAENAHKPFFDDLRSFLQDTKVRLTIMMGNHDPDLFWPKVQQRVRELLGSTDQSKLQFVRKSIKKGTAHIEHGHQYCSPENRFFNPDNITHICTADGKERLEMNWGTIFVMEYFNELEKEYPFADNVKTTMRALWLGIRNGWVKGPIIGRFIKFLVGVGVPWSSITANVLSDQKREAYQVIQQVDDFELRRELLKLYERDSETKFAINDEIANTTEKEWKAINQAVHPAVNINMLSPEVEDASPTLGIFRDEPEFRGASQILGYPDVEYVVFGHTHMEIDGGAEDARVGKYFNTGSWINSLDLSVKANRQKLKDISELDLTDGTLFDLRLRQVVIDVTDTETKVSLSQI
jgi:UDP-2,3-diacylglucosamine pyrophosphatase LpxH